MAEEKIVTINLRKEIIETPRWKRSKAAIRALRAILERRLKSKKIKIGKSVNEKIWAKGAQKPPSKIKIMIIKSDDGFQIEAV